MTSDNAARGRALGSNTLACGHDGIYLWPGTPLTERQGAAIRPRDAQEIYRAVAVLHGTAANTPGFFAGLARAARLLCQGNVEKALALLARIELPPVRREGIALLEKFAKFNPNHYGPGPQGGQFAPDDGDPADTDDDNDNTDGEDGDQQPSDDQKRNYTEQLADSSVTGFTNHGINRAIERGVSPSAILDAVKNPTQILPQPGGTTMYVGRGAVVILNSSGSVITTWGQ
jgi:hypothetical protein